MREILIAPDGYVYANGETYGIAEVYLEEGMSKDEFYLITIEEYQKILEREAELNEYEDIQLEEEW